MLRKYSNYRTFKDNLQLGTLTSFSAGMVNVISVIIFFAYTSNITGHYAILAQEVSKGNWYQAAVVFIWIGLFMGGSFTSNFFVIRGQDRRYLSHVIPVLLELACLLGVALYLQYGYGETLKETETLVGVLLFAMGLQNGLTASVSNFSVKTTHLTGLTTDLGILLSMLTKKEYRQDVETVKRTMLLIAIMISYVTGGIFAGVLYAYIDINTFYVVCALLTIVTVYDYYKLGILKLIQRKQPYIRKDLLNNSQSAPKKRRRRFSTESMA
jgi:uncharacterized membrane protein YoaK (UPF0700 family)